MALQPFVGPWPLFSFLILYTVGTTPWTGDQPFARSPSIQWTTQIQNKRTLISILRVGFESTISVFERGEDGSYLRLWSEKYCLLSQFPVFLWLGNDFLLHYFNFKICWHKLSGTRGTSEILVSQILWGSLHSWGDYQRLLCQLTSSCKYGLQNNKKI
jgi:hypothetical protein